MDPTTATLSVISGGLVGFVLGVIGGGGSILALPLLVYVVGFHGDPHTALGTTALAVSASAFANMLQHRRNGYVRLELGLWFALPGVAGALLGARLGLSTPGDKLLFLFALLMLVVAWRLWRPPTLARPKTSATPHTRAFRRRAVIPVGFAVGALSGYFGIGGGFLIVPALMWAADLELKAAIGTSLVAVSIFGLTTATRYGIAGKLDFPFAALFILGGVLAGIGGTRVADRLPKETLRHVFALVLVLVSGYMLYRNYAAFT
jgi:hypothetical protein